VRDGLGLRVPPPREVDPPTRLVALGAARLGSTRLIDNVDVVPRADDD